MSDGIKIVLTLGAFALVAVIMIVRTSDRDDADSVAGLSQGTTPSEAFQPGIPAGTDVEPTGENVSHSFFLQRKELEDRIEDNPSDTTSIRLLARLLHDAHQFDEAATRYETYLQFRTSERQLWLDLASVYAAGMKWDEAKSAMERMLALFPDDPAALYNLGAIHANQGALDEARSRWLKVSRQTVDPELRDRAIQALFSLDSR